MNKQPHVGLTREKESRAQYVIEQALAAHAKGGRPAADAVIARLLAEDWQGNGNKPAASEVNKVARSTNITDLIGIHPVDQPSSTRKR